MTPSFACRLINDPFEDPGLYVRLRWQRRALLFDLGSLQALPPGDLVKVTEAYVTHAHIDHFIGLDHLLRLLLRREAGLRIVGPAGIRDRVEAKLAGYTWNLVEGYPLRVAVDEVGPEAIRTATFACAEGFRRRNEGGSRPFAGTVWAEPAFTIRAVHLDHGIPCLGFALEEAFHITIDPTALARLDLPPGPWLGEFKAALRDAPRGDASFRARIRREGRIEERDFRLADLAAAIARITPGQKVAYVADVGYTPENARRIVDLAVGVDCLYCEAAYLDRDADRAAARAHLTARQAGLLAREAGVRRLVLFHFSPMYRDEPEALLREAAEAFGRGPDPASLVAAQRHAL